MEHNCVGRNFTHVADYISEVKAVLAQVQQDAIERAINILVKAQHRNRTIFLFGNGGSAALASHVACDLGKGTADVVRKRVRVLSLTDNVPLITAWANDTSYDRIFAEQLENFVVPGDVAFAISGSGNSANVLRGLQAAQKSGASTVGLSGFQGGKMKALCDPCIVIPSDNMQIIEDLHLMVAHSVFTVMRARLQEPIALAVTAD